MTANLTRLLWCNMKAPTVSYMKRKIDETTFIEAYDTYAEAIFRYCFFRIGDRDRAKDLMQETFTNAWAYVQKGKEIENLRAFLYRVAHNACVNEIRRSKAQSLEVMQEAGFDPADERMRSPETEAEAALVRMHLAKLPGSAREVLTLRYMDGLPVNEIAVILKESPNTISVRIHRALGELQKRMQTL